MFTVQALILFLILGALAGILAGLFGIGGGIILIPCFLWAFPIAHFSPEIIVHTAFGTSLAIIIPTAISSAWGHRKRGNVDFHAASRLAIGSIIGVVLGSTLAAGLSGDLLKGLMGMMQIGIGLRMFLQSPPPEGRQRCDALLPALLIGLVVGTFSAFFGVGGGIIAVPLMVYFLGQSMHQAVGTSSALMVISALFGTASYIWHGWGHPGLPLYSLGYVNFLVALIVAPLTVLFARVGVRIATKSTHKGLFKAFALFIIFIGLNMVVKNLLF
ncbi:MAG: sulfite exporter TauE/SafE family protein [Desulfuromonadales bacterium]|nr:sulfite exporter TauE/SafE family protein [Desulfuromonadales bacterium]